MQKSRSRKLGMELEEYVAHLFRMSNYKVSLNDNRFGADIDVLVEEKIGSSTSLTLVECKDFRQPLNYAKVAKFVDTANMLVTNGKAEQAFVVSRSGYTPACRNTASQAGHVELLTIPELEDRLLKLNEIRNRTRDYLAHAKLNLTHIKAEFPRLPLRCMLLNHKKPQSLDIDMVLEDWLYDPYSNFAIIFGKFGSGKSATLVHFIDYVLENFGKTHWRTPIFMEYKDVITNMVGQSTVLESVFDRLLLGDPVITAKLKSKTQMKNFVFAFDGYDELHLYGTKQTPSPDLRQISDLISPTSKVIITCRRSYMSLDDELIKQLSDSSRAKRFGLIRPLILEIETWDIPTLKKAIKKLPAKRTRSILDYLETFRYKDVDYLRRPLLLQMLLELDLKMLGSERTLTVGELYDRYTEMILTRDFDRNESLISGRIKSEILTRLASDVFNATNIESSGISNLSEYGITLEQMTIRVMEAITSDPQLVLSYNWSASNYQWISDFIRTNHILTEIRTGSQTKKRFTFFHNTFYEYFLAKYFLSKINNTEAFGIQEEHAHANEAIFDSLVIYFIKNGLDSLSYDRLYTLANRETLGHLDRMLAIYLLEDYPKILELLQNAGNGYRNYLLSKEKTISSHFLKKIIKYQLLLMYNDMNRAFEYVKFLREMEREEDAELEWRIFSAPLSSSEFLVKRLHNPQLAAAKPITIYRLGQFGNKMALDDLVRERSELPRGSPFQSLIEEAVGKIKSRLKKSQIRNNGV